MVKGSPMCRLLWVGRGLSEPSWELLICNWSCYLFLLLLIDVSILLYVTFETFKVFLTGNYCNAVFHNNFLPKTCSLFRASLNLCWCVKCCSHIFNSEVVWSGWACAQPPSLQWCTGCFSSLSLGGLVWLAAWKSVVFQDLYFKKYYFEQMFMKVSN